MVSETTHAKMQRELALFDRAPEHIRRLVNDYGMDAVVQVATLLGGIGNNEQMIKLLDRNRLLEQEKTLAKAAFPSPAPEAA